MKKSWILKLFSYWPPFFGSGIRVVRISPDFREVDVEMKLRFWNRNYVGTHFGGSLYSMTDPFFMLMLMENLGKNYIVWDKAASIRFKKPGKGRVSAQFRLSLDQVEAIRMKADAEGKMEPIFQVQVMDDENQLIAEVEKVLYVRKKSEANRS